MSVFSYERLPKYLRNTCTEATGRSYTNARSKKLHWQWSAGTPAATIVGWRWASVPAKLTYMKANWYYTLLYGNLGSVHGVVP